MTQIQFCHPYVVHNPNHRIVHLTTKIVHNAYAMHKCTTGPPVKEQMMKKNKKIYLTNNLDRFWVRCFSFIRG